jgi:hydroxymethylpyrimidine/phosphomethylpyrimidine kinase
MHPIALTIAGSDPSGGAGIQADLKTFAAFGVYGASVITALTAQNTRGVSAVHGLPPELVRAQAEAVLDDLAVGAIKVGMLGDAATIEVVAGILRSRPELPVVLDPVMVAASGDPLLAEEAVGALRESLLPLATLVTPNAHEAALLLRDAPAADEDGLALQAARLRVLGPGAALVKGGRLADPRRSVDALATRSGVELLAAPRVAIARPHGTGCTLSSSVAAGLALGMELAPAVRAAKAYVSEALERAAATPIGTGARPLVHAPRA